MPNKLLTVLIERLEALDESIDSDSYLHPLCAKDDLKAAIDVVQRLEAVIAGCEFIYKRATADIDDPSSLDTDVIQADAKRQVVNHILRIAKGESDE